MDEQVVTKVKELIRRAKEEGTKNDANSKNRNRSSLSKIIKTKAQADRFMKLLKSA